VAQLSGEIVDEEWYRRRLELAIQRCRSRWSELEQRVFQMAYLEGIADQEIADRLGIEMGYEYVLKSRARKKIEQAFGIERSERTRGLDGWDAVRLWDAYQRGRGDALDLLVEYNLEDVKNLEPLAQWVYEQHCGRLKPDMEAATTVP